MSFKISYVFGSAPGQAATAGGSYNWSENWYYGAAFNAATYDLVALNYISRRIGLLTPGWACKFYRVYNWPNSRQGVKRNVPILTGQGTYAGVAAGDEQPYDVLIVDVTSTSGRTRAWGMRGISRDVVTAGGVYTGPGAFQLAFANFMGNALTANQSSLRKSTVVATYTSINFAIAGVFGPYTATPQRPVITLPDLGVGIPVAPNTIRVSGVLGMAHANGIWQLRSATVAGGFWYGQLAPKRGNTVLGLQFDPGKFTVLAYDLDPVIGASPSRGSSHRTGGPFDRPRGRRPRGT